MAEAELSVAVGPRATRLAISAATSGKVRVNGRVARCRGNRQPP